MSAAQGVDEMKKNNDCQNEAVFRLCKIILSDMKAKKLLSNSAMKISLRRIIKQLPCPVGKMEVNFINEKEKGTYN